MRLRLSIIFCFASLLLTGWGHLGPKVKIGVSLDHTQGREPFLNKIREVLNDDHSDLLLKDPGNDPVAQASQVKDLIQQGIQTLVVIPCDPSKATSLVTAAHAAGIKVIALERLIPDSDLDYFIDFNYKKAGELQARAIVKKAPKGNYELVDGYPEDWKTEDLRKGQMKVLQPLIDCGDIQIEASKKGLPANDHKVTTAILTNSNINLMGSEPAESKKSDNVESQKLYIAGVGQNLMTCRRIVSGTQTMTVYAPPKKLAEETAYLAAKLARKATEFDCQFVEIPNGKKNVKAVLLTPLAVDAKNLDSTIIADQVQKKEDVYGK